MWPGGINIKILFEKRIKFITRSYYIHSLLKHVKGGGQNGLELLARGGRQAPPAVPGGGGDGGDGGFTQTPLLSVIISHLRP